MKQFEFDPEHTFFTSDTHFGHANIINLCKRPFKDINHMNDMLVESGMLLTETEKDTSIQKHLTEMLTAKCGTVMEKHILLQVNCLMV